MLMLMAVGKESEFQTNARLRQGDAFHSIQTVQYENISEIENVPRPCRINEHPRIDASQAFLTRCLLSVSASHCTLRA